MNDHFSSLLRPFVVLPALLACLLALGAPGCGGRDRRGMSDAGSSDGGPSGLDGGGAAVDAGTDPGSSCDLVVHGSCQCSTADFFSDCYESAEVCWDAVGERGSDFVAMSASNDCPITGDGTWSTTPCPREGVLGGCRVQTGSTAGTPRCPIYHVNWYYPDPEAGITTSADVMRVCGEVRDGEFVEP